MTPEAAMRRALAHARLSRGRTFPNPPVGAAVYRGDRLLAVGRTRPVGGPHAEVVALRTALRRHGARAVRGASLAVTLEPCCHTGRTPPCTDALIEAGIREVFVGHRDPHPEVAGRGARRLRRAGLSVELGVLEAACREQHRGFLSVCDRGRPFVTLKLAGSLDGRIATKSGESRWITGGAARAFVHRLRARSDAVMVGSGTARADDPELTARRGARVVHRPVRVVVDSRLRLSPQARICRGDPERTWVLSARSAPGARRRALEARGVRVLTSTTRRGRLDLRAALERLAEEGLTEMLVEGGGGLAAALLDAQVVDRVEWFVAPRVLGGDGRPAVGALAAAGGARLADAPALADVAVRRLGDDVHVSGILAPTGRARGAGRSR